MTRIAIVRYDQNRPGGPVGNHVALEGMENDIIARIRKAYGEEPVAVGFKSRGGMLLDSGGIVLLDQPKLRCRLSGYGVYYKLEHAPYIAKYLEERIADMERRRVYGGRECVTVYQRFWITVLPLEDAQAVLRHLKKNATRGFVVGDQRRAELAADPHFHIPDKTPAEA